MIVPFAAIVVFAFFARTIATLRPGGRYLAAAVPPLW
jgi:hypothetical protein